MKFTASTNSTILLALAEHFSDVSKSTIRQWLAHERVRINGMIVKKGNAPVIAGDAVTIEDKKKAMAIAGMPILYEDRDLVVLEKPVGLLSVATDFEREETVHHLLKQRRRTVYPVHRLDREVSGIMVFAYTKEGREGLKEQFFHHTIKRAYIALVEGTFEQDHGTWTSLLSEDANYVVKSASQGKRAVTHFKVVEKRENSSLLEIQLETGRKNQIRVHCSEAGHPILGDLKYGAKSSPYGRVCLHAYHLEFQHPVSNRRLSFTTSTKEAWKAT